MSNLRKWCEAILNEDADKMSIGSVRTIQLIKQEFERLQKENNEKDEEIKDRDGLLEERDATIANLHELKSYYKDQIVGMENQIASLEAENERLNDIIEKQYLDNYGHKWEDGSMTKEESLQQFKAENNL